MTVFMTPDGTVLLRDLLPADARQAFRRFGQVLAAIAEAWRERPGAM